MLDLRQIGWRRGNSSSDHRGGAGAATEAELHVFFARLEPLDVGIEGTTPGTHPCFPGGVLRPGNIVRQANLRQAAERLFCPVTDILSGIPPDLMEPAIRSGTGRYWKVIGAG